MSFSIGYAFPSGDATGAANDGMTSTFSGQVPFTLEIGGNVTPSLFLGAYGTFAPGGLAGTTSSTCAANQLDCSAHSVHGGLAVRYRFLPGELVEPWIGYAAGYESNSLSISNAQASASGELKGWEFARISIGLDVLAARMIAFGPFVDFGIGQYGHMYFEQPNRPTVDTDIPNSGIHQWITLGVRTVIMP
jgi:hypothetical protein